MVEFAGTSCPEGWRTVEESQLGVGGARPEEKKRLLGLMLQPIRQNENE
jgi:hypothetical protein